MLGLDLPTFISRVLILVISLTFHEFAHAWSASRFGDDTPEMNGRLSLNPLVHLDPIGSLMLIFAGFGWAKPVPVNPYVLSRAAPSALMWVSLAGPMSNFLLAILAAVPFRLGLISRFNPASTGQLPTLSGFLEQFILINLLLMLFNLIPLAPLDGDKIADYFFPPPLARVLEVIRPYGPIILLAVVFMLPYVLGFNLFWMIIGPPMQVIFRLLVG